VKVAFVRSLRMVIRGAGTIALEASVTVPDNTGGLALSYKADAPNKERKRKGKQGFS